jgi:prepilin-type N-terminal cleavage/methylation domain-containing protein
MLLAQRARRTSASRGPHTGGFTLIELMVVILIILILMAALMPVYNKILLKTKRESTQAMIGALAASLERYKVEFDAYPPGSATGSEDDGSLFAILNGQTGRGVVANVGTPREKHFEPFLTIGKEYIKADASGSKLIIVDSWGMPIHYFNCKAFVEDHGGNPKLCHNPTGVDIYSTGQDRKKDEATEEPGQDTVKDRSKISAEEKLKTDDITNF